MEYNGKYYLITAGHAVENEYGKFKNFKFKANFSNTWIYPKLLAYENDFFNNRDYAIFYSDKIKSGLDFKTGSFYPEYILGNSKINILKKYNRLTLIPGDSGSPVIDLDGKVLGIATGNFVDIKIVLNKIDEIK